MLLQQMLSDLCRLLLLVLRSMSDRANHDSLPAYPINHDVWSASQDKLSRLRLWSNSAKVWVRCK
jgi:hypothetical protein